jgi:hypothetical protein
MARLVRDPKLETRTARARLPISPKPYFRRLEIGFHLGIPALVGCGHMDCPPFRSGRPLSRKSPLVGR